MLIVVAFGSGQAAQRAARPLRARRLDGVFLGGASLRIIRETWCKGLADLHAWRPRSGSGADFAGCLCRTARQFRCYYRLGPRGEGFGRHRRDRQQARLRFRQRSSDQKTRGSQGEEDVVILGIGSQAERWAALSGGHVDASVFQPPVTLRARKLGFPVWLDFSKIDYEYVVAGPVTTRSFIRAERETVMNFMRGLADGMDFYRDEKNRDAVLKHLGEFYR